jgi:hypothetical protein
MINFIQSSNPMLRHDDLELKLLADGQRQPLHLSSADRTAPPEPLGAAGRVARLDAVDVHGELPRRRRRAQAQEHHLADDQLPARPVRVVNHVRPHRGAAGLRLAAEPHQGPLAPRPGHLRRLAVVQEQLPGRGAVLAECDKEVEHGLARARRGQRRPLQRQDVAAGHVHVHCVRGGRERHARARRRGGSKRVVEEAEPPAGGEVGVDGGGARLEHRRHEHAAAEQELPVHPVGVHVLGVGEEERPRDGRPRGVRLVHERVDVRQQPVAQPERLPCRPRHRLPQVELSPDGADRRVVPRERVEGAELHR